MDILAASEITNFTYLIKEDLKGQNLEYYHEENEWGWKQRKREWQEDAVIQPRVLAPHMEKVGSQVRKHITLLKTAEFVWKEWRKRKAN